MSELPIALTFYTSTKGHWGHKEIYKETLSSLSKKAGLHIFGNLSAHIKWSKGEEGEAEEIRRYMLSMGFAEGGIHSTQGDWSHANQSMAKEYFSDMSTLLNSPRVQECEFVLHMEDDWFFSCEDGGLGKFLDRAVRFLKANGEVLSVRFNHDIEKNIDSRSEASVFDPTIRFQNLNYTPYGPTFTFQPTVVRTRDWKHAVNGILKDWGRVGHTHCELLSGAYLKLYSTNTEEKPFAFFDPEVVSVEHIGVQDYHPKAENT